MSQLYYIRTTKSGSTSLMNWMCGNNVDFKKYQFFIKKNYNYCYVGKDRLYEDIRSNKKYKFFTVVRNPWERAVSAWVYTTKCSNIFWNNEKTQNYSFVDFLETPKNSFNKFQQEHFKSQYEIICDQHGKIDYLDHIGKLEKIKDTIEYIKDNADVSGNTQYKISNKTRHKHYTEYYDDETLKLVGEIYSKDINSFGYKYGD